MIPSLWVAAFFIAVDFIGVFNDNSQVAHYAHLGRIPLRIPARTGTHRDEDHQIR